MTKSNLVGASLLSNESVDGNHKHHDSDTGEDRRAKHHPQEVETDAHLERSRPDHVDVCRELHEPLGINRHEVHNLTDRRLLASSITQLQRLQQLHRIHDQNTE